MMRLESANARRIWLDRNVNKKHPYDKLGNAVAIKHLKDLE